MIIDNPKTCSMRKINMFIEEKASTLGVNPSQVANYCHEIANRYYRNDPELEVDDLMDDSEEDGIYQLIDNGYIDNILKEYKDRHDIDDDDDDFDSDEIEEKIYNMLMTSVKYILINMLSEQENN